MSDPATIEEYNARCAANARIEGFLDLTTSVLPCPGCGAADWLRWNIVRAALDGYAKVGEPHACRECGRTFRQVIRRTDQGALQYVEQTAGPDLPAYLKGIGFIRDGRPGGG